MTLISIDKWQMHPARANNSSNLKQREHATFKNKKNTAEPRGTLKQRITEITILFMTGFEVNWAQTNARVIAPT